MKSSVIFTVQFSVVQLPSHLVQHHFNTLKENPTGLSGYSQRPAPCRHQSLSLRLHLLPIFYNNENICDLLCPAYFTYHNVFKVYLCCGICTTSALLFFMAILYCIVCIYHNFFTHSLIDVFVLGFSHFRPL